MSEPEKKLCLEVEEHLAEVLDGTADERLYEHLADCDACRDLRHEAERLKEHARAAGADYEAPADLEARLERRLDAESDIGAPRAKTEPEASESKKSERAPGVSEPKAGPSARQLRWVGGGVLAAAAALLALRGGGDGETTAASDGGGSAWRGKLERVVTAAGGEGLKVCDRRGELCRVVEAGADVPAASRVKTDARTRARLRLADGSLITLERATELELGADGPRRALLRGGALTADIAHSKSEARFELPVGTLTVHGTKFALRAGGGRATVDVTRGSVTLANAKNQSVRVNAGESGRLNEGSAPVVDHAAALGEALAWSEETFGERERAPQSPRGLGELKAKRPGQDGELSGAVTLRSHSVRVRIAGTMARTEIEEVFENQTDQVLEGIYRFPIPPDAQIERLALEVDGKLEEGAFLDRERAAAIWRGAIVNAAPKAPPQREEIVWVPGPWKDPALLEWQRGGRFELRIFPIPKRGERRVILTYTELIKPSGGSRRYTYPLAYDPSGSNRVGRFDVDVEVRGHQRESGLRVRGYDLAQRDRGDAAALSFAARDFAPSGDLELEYALPGDDAELTAFSYHETGSRLAATPSRGSAAIPAEARDGSPYVALALRPRLPRAERETHRTVAIVVDASRSMLGESYRRASELAVRLVRELDDADRALVLACDSDCRALPGGELVPGAPAAAEVTRFLGSVTPEGGSDVVGAVRSAVKAAGGSRPIRVVYLGDGAPTVGEVRPGTVERAVRRSVDRGRASVTSVAVGVESDSALLAALARGGGGVMLPYTPGQSLAEVSYAVLGATYGQALSDVSLTLPDGLSAVAPKALDAIPAGGEAIVVARMNNLALDGDVVLRGRVGNRPFEQRYPLSLKASENRGNAFVPRVYAALRIADLEREGTTEAKTAAIALSSRFNVASRYTSLLVLESPAMFRAFGLDNTRYTPEWTGEEQAESEASVAELALDADDEGAGSGVGTGSGPSDKLGRRFDSGASSGASSAPRAAPKASMRASSDEFDPFGPGSSDAVKEKKDFAPSPAPAPSSVFVPDPPPPSRRSRPMVPMRRIWERAGEIFTDRTLPRDASSSELDDAERELERNENRREALKKAFVLSLRSGETDRARRLAERWSDKEPLDPDAITARADVLAQAGERARAIRVLGGVVDVRPGDVASQKRLARLERWAGRPERGCRYSIAIAELRASDAALLADAVRCARETGESALASELLGNADDKTRAAAEALLAKPVPDETALSGDLRVEATFSGGVDVDLALLHPDGHRVSWLGAPTRSLIRARDAASETREGLALSRPQAGEYVIEVVRGAGAGRASGELVIFAAGSTRRVPFTLDGERVAVAVARIKMVSRLVPLRTW